MSSRVEVAVDFICDRCAKTLAAARFTQTSTDPQRAVAPPADWYEVTRGTESPWHFCSKGCLSAWSARSTIGAP